MKITLKDTGLQSTYEKRVEATFPIAFGKWISVASFIHNGSGGFPSHYYLRDEHGELKEITRTEFKDYLLNYLNKL